MVSLLIFVGSSHAGTDSLGAREFEEAATRHLLPLVEARNFSGSVLVVRGHEILFRRAFGPASVAPERSNAPDTRFRIGSISKSFTSAAVLLLRDRGQLDLRDPIDTYIPGFPRGDEITILNLLSHTSGLGRFVFMENYTERSTRHHSTVELVDWAREVPQSADPGTQYAYSNANFALLAHIVEQVSGMGFGEFLQVAILEPLQLEDTDHQGDSSPLPSPGAAGLAPVGFTDLAPSRYYDYSIDLGSGSMYSTTSDLWRWVEAIRAGKLLSAESIALMLGTAEDATSYAWHREEWNGHECLRVNGWDGVGFAGCMLNLTDEDLTVIVLSNLNISSIAENAAKNLAALAIGEEAEEWHTSVEPVDPQEATAIVGSYRFGQDFYVPDAVMKISDHGGRLFVEGEPPGALLKVGNGEFIHRQHWIRVHFVREDGRAVTGMRYGRFLAPRDQGGQTATD